ncbi:hypothetical protein SAMN05444515_101346 [Ectothiorhodospira marina]|uniref:Uncharacterized protein n=1 Tax=Ectothiorhodospira marina TaxID=1396821 RepID=A0A1H7FV28_9GAMM|nr:hypothetical protein SAMN05444515_101346 [Ectothiorhodospira marina]
MTRSDIMGRLFGRSVPRRRGDDPHSHVLKIAHHARSPQARG